MEEQLAKVQPIEAIEKQPARVFLAMPNYGNIVNEGTVDAVHFASRRNAVAIKFSGSVSALTHNFNRMWAMALNKRKEGITHFCMLHADIGIEQFWLDKMLDLMEKHDADVLSAIVPIKDPTSGITSTALDEGVGGMDPQWRVRRLTLHEVHNKYPGTFTDEKLLLNTGCMLVDLRKPIAWEKLCFRFENAIIPNPTVPGELMPVFFPEDWLFSRDAKKLGAKLFATREVKLYHEGTVRFSNGCWGKWETDQLTPQGG